ncbi:MAG: sialate O-acetylesterase [Fuerstiella sp.]|nr:sialate O-acetylesterase [Fuerstiella sp.]
MKPPTIRSMMLLATCLLAVFGNNADADQKPLKVFILVGQSNMQGHAHVRTFEHVGMDPKTAPLLHEMQNDDGTARVCEDVWISYLSSNGEKLGRLTSGFGADENKIGPELTFGIYMQKSLNQPILIIKTASGGKSLHTDFRSPSAGPYEFNEAQLEGFRKQNKDIEAVKADRVKATGHYYRLTIDYVKKVLADINQVYPDYESDQGYELAGLVWFQGWNDMVDRGVYPNRDKAGGYDQYSNTLACFIRDVRKDLSAPELPFVIGVMGAGGPVDKYLPDQQRYSGIHTNFRMAMAAPALMPEFKGNVTAVLTENYWDLQLVDLRAREAKINQKVKKLQTEQELSREEQQATREKLRAEEFSERDLETLQKGVSNAEYHYLGSAKIMAQIGKGFAEAMGKIAVTRSSFDE